jgi:hypothetical protein
MVHSLVSFSINGIGQRPFVLKKEVKQRPSSTRMAHVMIVLPGRKLMHWAVMLPQSDTTLRRQVPFVMEWRICCIGPVFPIPEESPKIQLGWDTNSPDPRKDWLVLPLVHF